MFNPSLYVPYFTVVRRNLTLQVGVGQIAQPNVNRVGLIVTGPTSQSLLLDVDANLLQTTAAFMQPNGGTQEIWWERHGALVCEGWYCRSGISSTVIAVTEIIWQPLGV